MKKDDYITEVIFRKWNRKNFKGDIIALFPYEIFNLRGDILSYEHIGQHSGADYDDCILQTTPAKENEYNDLKTELESIGYNLKVVKKLNYKRYLQELSKVKNQYK
jgi:chromosome segregation and condensation protein ScpB